MVGRIPMRTELAKKLSVHKWQNLAILDRTLLSIKCPARSCALRHADFPVPTLHGASLCHAV